MPSAMPSEPSPRRRASPSPQTFEEHRDRQGRGRIRASPQAGRSHQGRPQAERAGHRLESSTGSPAMCISSLALWRIRCLSSSLSLVPIPIRSSCICLPLWLRRSCCSYQQAHQGRACGRQAARSAARRLDGWLGGGAAGKGGDEFAERMRPVLAELASHRRTRAAAELNARKIATAAGGRWYPATVIRLRERLAL